MDEPAYIMKQCPKCKTFSLPINMICLNCNTRWIFKSVYDVKLVDVVIGVFLGVAIVLFMILLLDHWGLWKIISKGGN